MPDKFIEAVARGEVQGMTVDPGHPGLRFTPMDIDSPPGTKILFTDCNGSDADIAFARKFLRPGEVYTISKTDVGNWHTDVFLTEVPGKSFNCVHFATPE